MKKALKKDKVNLDEALYHLLHGVGLRKLAQKYGLCHTYLSALLQEKYGKGITSPDVTSLARSLIEDYGSSKESYEYALSVVLTGKKGEKFKSKASVKAATAWLTVPNPEVLDIIAVYDDVEPRQAELDWSYVYWWLNYVVITLAEAYYCNIGKLVVLQQVARESEYGDTKAS